MSARFTVDTHVFRELGELLVGRDSTALVELIKNSYDADATEVTIFAQALNDPEEGYILVTDDGTGMTHSQFQEGFLRIASRIKEEGERRSLKFKRRFTGAKGIGRLAAHKLAKFLSISSVPAKELGERTGVDATIDWELVEQCETLEDLATQQSSAIIVQPKKASSAQQSGTEIRLERLRKAWTPAEMTRFISEVQSFSPPAFLTYPDRSFIRPYSFLFESARTADFKKTAPFIPKLQGDFAPGHDYWKEFAENADWFIEIDCATDPNVVKYQLTPTKHFRESFSDAKVKKFSVQHPGRQSAPYFQARIIVREGVQGKGPLKSWATINYGVRVFMEGFRVLPYGERSNDWLELDRQYVERMRSSDYLKKFGFAAHEEEDDRHALLQHLGNRNYYGAVFLTQEGAGNLRMLVNREGFVPDSTLDNLSSLVRLGVDLTTRARAAAKFEARQERRKSRRSGDSEATVTTGIGIALKRIGEVRTAVAEGNFSTANATLTEAESTLRDFGERVAEENAMLRILASVGSQMAAFVHEINATLGMTEAIEVAIGRLDTAQLTPAARRELAKIQKALGDLRRHLERQATYLVDVVATDARRRRTRNSFSDRFEAALRLVARSAASRNIEIDNRIPSDLKSFPMFPAELTSIFSNLLTNAIKAAGHDGKIRASAKVKEGDHILIRIENTGAEIDISDGERWFLPFESTTAKVDAVLGQGMGLGLTITRNILEQYGASIKFVKPSSGFSTSIEMTFPLKV